MQGDFALPEMSTGWLDSGWTSWFDCSWAVILLTLLLEYFGECTIMVTERETIIIIMRHKHYSKSSVTYDNQTGLIFLLEYLDHAFLIRGSFYT